MLMFQERNKFEILLWVYWIDKELQNSHLDLLIRTAANVSMEPFIPDKVLGDIVTSR